jgi:hypothetical protein
LTFLASHLSRSDPLFYQIQAIFHYNFIFAALHEHHEAASETAHTTAYQAGVLNNAVNAYMGNNNASTAHPTVNTGLENPNADDKHWKTHAAEAIAGHDLDGDGHVGNTGKHGAKIDSVQQQIAEHLQNQVVGNTTAK